MFQSKVFDYVNVLNKAADASWLRNEAIGNNLSNVDTPGYKRQDVAFEAVLKRELGNSIHQTTDAKVSALDMSRLNPSITMDYSNYSYRLDSNNVDVDAENAMLAANQVKYMGLMTSINQEFMNLQTVMK